MSTNGPTDGTSRRWKPPRIVVRHGQVERFLRARRRTGRLRDWLPLGLIVGSVLSVLVVRGGPWLVRQIPPSVRQMGVEAAQRLRAPVYGAAARPPKTPERQKEAFGCAQVLPEAVAQPPAQIAEPCARHVPRSDPACPPPESCGVQVAGLEAKPLGGYIADAAELILTQCRSSAL